MEGRILPFKKQVEALRTGKYNREAANIVVDNLRSQVANGHLRWADLETTSGELELLLAKSKFSSTQ